MAKHNTVLVRKASGRYCFHVERYDRHGIGDTFVWGDYANFFDAMDDKRTQTFTIQIKEAIRTKSLPQLTPFCEYTGTIVDSSEA